MRLSTSVTEGRARREEYYALRRGGMSFPDACAALGIAPHHNEAGGRYERWFQAIERGETPVPGRQGRRPGGWRRSG